MSLFVGTGAFGGGRFPTQNYVSTAWTSFGGITNITFAAQGIGTAGARRRIVIATMSFNNTVTAVDIDGVTCTALAGSNPIFWISDSNITSGTTADIGITVATTAASTNVAISVWAVYDLRYPATLQDSATSTSNPATLSLDVPTHGVAFAAAMSTTAVATFTWSGMTQDYAVGTTPFNIPRSAASYTATSAVTPLTVGVTYSAATSPRSASISLR